MNFDYYQDDDEEDENPQQYQEDLKNKKRKFTKNDAIYGIFNDGWTDYDNDDNADGGTQLNEEDYYKLKKRYQTPVGFVASGIYEPNSKKDTENQDDVGGSDSDSEAKKEKKKKKKEKKLQQKKKKFQQQDDDNDDQNLEGKRIGGIGAMLLSKMGYKGSGGLGIGGTGMVEPLKVFVRPKNAGLASVAEVNNDKLQESSSESSDGDTDSEDEGKRSLGWKKKEKVSYDFDEHIGSIKNSKKHHHHQKQLDQQQQQQQQQQKQIIIDMSGPEAKLINNLKDINKNQQSQHQQNENIKPLSEFKFNIELLLKFKELEIDQLNSKIKHEKDRIDNLNRGQEKLKDSIENDNKKISSVCEVIKLLETIQLQKQESSSLSTLTPLDRLKDIIKFFEVLKFKYTREYNQFQLVKLEKELLEPVLKELVVAWNIDNDPVYLLKQFKKLSIIFINQQDNSNNNNNNNSSYNSNNGNDNNNNNSGLNNYYYLILIKNIILPKFKQYFRNQWNVKNPFIAATLISKWSNVLPEVCQEILLEQSILPKLKVEIEKWNPQTDPIPIHQWLLPWIPFLKEELKTFFPSIRQKIISGLVDWDPQDESAFEILLPWKDVFESNTIQSILNRFIIPKLQHSIKSLVFSKQVSINQSSDQLQQQHQHSNEIDNLIKWKEFIGHDTIVSILDKDFFNNWIRFLFNWLTQANSNFEEISNWYSFWKNKIPNEFKSDSIKSKFSVAINLMKKAMNNESINLDDYKSILNNSNNNFNNKNNNNNNIKFKSITQPSSSSTTLSSPSSSSTKQESLNNLSMKQMIERIAVSNGLLFAPSQKKSEKGQQIYTFDKYSITIDKDLILILNNGKWEPANIQSLLESLNK